MLKHDISDEPRVVELFQNCNSVKEFTKRVPVLAQSLIDTDPLQYIICSDPKENFNVIQGKLFEVFCEILCKSFSFHYNVGLYDYCPVNDNDDWGVDAWCKNLSEHTTAVQAKFSIDHRRLYTGKGSHGKVNNAPYKISGGLDTFVSRAALEGRITGERDVEHHYTLVFITTGAGIDPVVRDDKYLSNVKSIGYKQLTTLVDDNTAFWNNAIVEIETVTKGNHNAGRL